MTEAAARLDRDDRIALKALCEPSDAAGLRQLGLHVLLIGIAGAGVYWANTLGWAAVLAAQFVLGVVLVFLFAPLHETIHRTAFKTRWINDLVAHVAGAVLVLPPRYFRAFHLEHHRYTQIPGKDPELDRPPVDTFGGYLIHVSGFRYWTSAVSGLVTRALGRTDAAFLTGRTGPKTALEARGYLVFYGGVIAVSIAFNSDVAVTYYLVPILLGQPVLRLYLMAEHGGCPLVVDMFRNTRTTLTAAPVRRLAWNMPYHVEHHAFMAVPFHRLAEVHERFKDRIEMLTPGYVAFHKETLGGLR